MTRSNMRHSFRSSNTPDSGGSMTRHWIATIIALTAMGTLSVARAEGTPPAGAEPAATHVSAAKATYKEVVPGVSKAVLWGDHDKGAYGAFTKFAPGFDAGMHTHTSDTWIVVIEGAYVYKDEAGEKRVGPGEFIRVPGGKKHGSSGDKAKGALFYEE